MSWGTTRKGTREEVKSGLTTDFVQFSASYPPGTLEGDDVALVKARCFTLLDVIDLTPSPYYEADLVKVEVSGSHGWTGTKETPTHANFKLSVERVNKGA
jgi:hypothetical protein